MHQKGPITLLLLLLLLCGGSVLAARPNGVLNRAGIQGLFSQGKFAGLHTASKEFYLSEDEKLVIALCNLARYDAQAFIKEVILPSGVDTSSKDFSQLLRTLRAHKSVFPLMPAFSLYKSALVHARDMGISGNSGHRSSDGKSFEERIQQYFPSQTGFAENYYQGSGEPLDIVLSFLMGKGEKGSDYRVNILSENLHYIGISIQPHRKSCSNAVLDFARKPQIAATTSHKRNDREVYWKDCPKGNNLSTTPRKSSGFSLSSLFGGRKK